MSSAYFSPERRTAAATNSLRLLRSTSVRIHRALCLVLTLLCFSLLSSLKAAEVIQADLCIYGGTAGGVAAAVQAARMGKTAVIAEFGNHLGGLTSGGLGATDIGNKAAIGGISREFYHRIALHYATSNAWRFEQREGYFAQRGGRSTVSELSSPDATMWTFEPHVAEDIFFQMLAEAKTAVYFQQRLASVQKEGGRITEITMENGKVYRAQMFIDATYEGDLMAKAGVSYTVGREGNSKYNETLNGVRAETPKHQFTVPVDPYVKAGDSNSGLLPFIQPGDGGTPGEGDASVQAYNFRLCYTKEPANRLPHQKPAKYDPAKYELLARCLEALVAAGQKPELKEFWNPIWMPNGKTDINNNGGFSTDFIGANYAYPNGDYATRAQIWQAHEDYVRGFVYFFATSPRVPEHMHAEMQTWGPAKDEFLDTGNWPHQLYVREARRMVSDYVMTEHNCRGKQKAEDPVGLGAYGMDSHNCQRIVKNGHAENEGDVQVHGFSPYPISYRSIVPKAAECENLLVPVCLSATHIAYGSIRMEPVFMILGQSAATAASLAMDGKASVQKLSYETLRARLAADMQVLEWKSPQSGRKAPEAGPGAANPKPESRRP
jgi:FAD dependent oxidoreductase